MRIIPSGIPPEHMSLAAALTAGATNPGEKGAVALLLRIPNGLWHRPDLADAGYVPVHGGDGFMAAIRVLWSVLPDHRTLSPSERSALRVCAALAQIGADLPALDVTVRVAVRAAMRCAASLPVSVFVGDPAPTRPLACAVCGVAVVELGGGSEPLRLQHANRLYRYDHAARVGGAR